MQHKVRGVGIRETCLKIVESKGAWGYQRGLDWHVLVLGFSRHPGQGQAPWICPADQQLNEATWQAQQRAALGPAAPPQQQQQQREQQREQERRQLEGVSSAVQQPHPPPAQQQSEQQQGEREVQQLEEGAAPQGGAQGMHGLEVDGETPVGRAVQWWDLGGQQLSCRERAPGPHSTAALERLSRPLI